MTFSKIKSCLSLISLVLLCGVYCYSSNQTPFNLSVTQRYNPFLQLNIDLLQLWAGTSSVSDKRLLRWQNAGLHNASITTQEQENDRLWNLKVEKNVKTARKIKDLADGTEEQLYKYLLNPQRYEKHIRPSIHHTLTTNVTFGFLLNQIVEMDERNQVLTTRCWLNINWFDPRLMWNHSEWNGIKNIYIPHSHLWLPDIVLTNNAIVDYESLVATDILVTEFGNVTYLFSAIFKSVCKIKVALYPFDDQECILRFGSWSHRLSELDLSLVTNEGDLSNYMNNSEFDLTNMMAYREVITFPTIKNVDWPTIVIKINLHRRSLFYIFNHILPCMLISSMSILAFLMPPETGQQVSVCVTTILSLGVSLRGINDAIPPSSDELPLIGLYYITTLFTVCLATAANVAILNIHRSGSTNQGRKIPWWVQKFILIYLARMLCMTVYEPDSVALSKTARRDATIRRKSIMRDLKKKKSVAEKYDISDTICECIDGKTNFEDSFFHLGKKRTIDSTPIVNSSYIPLLNVNGQHINLQESDMKRTVSFPYETSISPSLHSFDNDSARNINSPFFGQMINDGMLRDMDIKIGSAQEKLFQDTFHRILKRIYRTLQQHEIRDEILDERQRIKWQWQQIASVVDRFLLVLFSLATAATIGIFLIFPAFYGHFK